METSDNELHPGGTFTPTPHPLKTRLESQGLFFHSWAHQRRNRKREATKTTQDLGLLGSVPAMPPSPSLGSPCCCKPAQSQVSAWACAAFLYAAHTPRNLRFQPGTPALSLSSTPWRHCGALVIAFGNSVTGGNWKNLSWALLRKGATLSRSLDAEGSIAIWEAGGSRLGCANWS